MTESEKQFYDKKEKIDAFKAELMALRDKYDFGVKESDQYDGMDEYYNTEYYFIVDGEVYWVETISDILTEIFGKH